MSFELRFPQWKELAVTFSYDDGQIYDRRLVELFNRYCLKATFHLNSGILDSEGFVTKKELSTLYEGHEIACHGVYHEFPTHLTREQLIREFWQDRLTLEECTGRIIRGCSYAFGEYDENVVETLQKLGFVYSRTVDATGNFRVPERFLTWRPTCHHNDAFNGMAQQFLDKPEYRKLSLFYVWGHSFEFERQQTWDQMETFCREISGRPEVWYTTNIEYADYMEASRRLLFSADGKSVVNQSRIPIYALIDGEQKIL